MNLILDLLFPKRCVGCKKFDTYFCNECISNILQTDLICPNCFEISSGGQTHPGCEDHFGLDGLWSLGLYKGILREAIKKLKYEPFLMKDIIPVLVEIVFEYWVKYQSVIWQEVKKDKGKGWVVVSVPLHWFRQNKRGFNQSAEIGKLLSKKLGLDHQEGLKRIHATSTQTKLTSIDRQHNIKNAFEIAVDRRLLAESIILIDDVWTTGATLKECCHVLKKAGAKKVWAITLAR